MTAKQLVKKVIGLSEETAKKMIEENNFLVRIMLRDGKPLRGDCSYRKNRINLYIKNNIVVKAIIG